MYSKQTPSAYNAFFSALRECIEQSKKTTQGASPSGKK